MEKATIAIVAGIGAALTGAGYLIASLAGKESVSYHWHTHTSGDADRYDDCDDDCDDHDSEE